MYHDTHFRYLLETKTLYLQNTYNVKYHALDAIKSVCCNILNLMSNKSICANNGSSSTTKRWSTDNDLINLWHWSKI